MKNNIFCIKRLFLLMRRDLQGNVIKNAIGIGSIVGALLLITLLSGVGDTGFHISGLFALYLVTFLIAGYVYTSTVFSELNSKARSVAALTLPVSKLERLVNAWLLTAIVFPVLAIAGMLVISLVTGLIYGQQSVSNILQVLFSSNTVNLIRIYIITQSLFLFGAIYFRRYNFFKTLGSVFLVQVVFQIFFMILMLVIIGKSWDFEERVVNPEFERFFATTGFEIIKFTFYYLLAPFFWILTYLGIKEREV